MGGIIKPASAQDENVHAKEENAVKGRMCPFRSTSLAVQDPQTLATTLMFVPVDCVKTCQLYIPRQHTNAEALMTGAGKAAAELPGDCAYTVGALALIQLRRAGA